MIKYFSFNEVFSNIIYILTWMTDFFTNFSLYIEFGRPFQLSSDVCDVPVDGVARELKVQEGDLVVVATDGVWDNLHLEFLEATLWAAHERAREGELLVLYFLP